MSYQENQISEEEHTNTDNVVCPHCGYYDEMDSQQDLKKRKELLCAIPVRKSLDI